MLGRPSPLQATDRSVNGLGAGPQPREAIRPWRALLVAALLCTLLGAELSSLLAGGGSAPLPAGPAGRTLAESASLAAAVRGPASASLGAANRAYHFKLSDRAFQASSPAQQLNARLSASGVRLSTHTLKLGLSLRAVGFGSALRAVSAVAPTASANRVTYARRGMTEWYVNGPLGLEQGFTLTRAPGGERHTGPLTLSMELAGGDQATLAPGGQSITLGHGVGSLRYDGLQASDATGRALHSWMQVRGARVVLRVDAAGARYPLRIDPLIQEGPKIASAENVEDGLLGITVALSGDGNTALVGAPGGAETAVGAAFVFERSGTAWVQQGTELTSGEAGVASGMECEEEAEEEVEACAFGRSVALSADGDTALVGAPRVGGAQGAVWVFTRPNSESSFNSAQMLLGEGEEGHAGRFGRSVALSADGSTALIGSPADNGGRGAVWAFARTGGGSFAKQGAKLTASNESGEGHFGLSIGMSADGNTALIGTPGDSTHAGAAWVFSRSGVHWTQGQKLTGGAEESEQGRFGFSVALSSDGQTALVGARSDEGRVGAAWVFAAGGGTFNAQGPKLTGENEVGLAEFGYSVALSASGDSALIGGPRNEGGTGAAWLLTRSGSAWRPEEELTPGEEGNRSGFGADLALSSDAKSAIVGAPHTSDHGLHTQGGGVWSFVEQPLPQPVFEHISPKSGPPQGGSSVTIKGTNFRIGGTSVSFGGSSATSVSVTSSTTLTAVSPSAPEGTVDVTVTTGGGTSAIAAADKFKYVTPKAGAGLDGEGEEPGSTKSGSKSSGSTTNAGGSGSPSSSATPAGGVQSFTGAASAACQVSLHSKHIAVALHKSAAIRLMRTGTGQCVGTVTLRYKQQTKGKHFKLRSIGTARFSIAPGKSQVIRINLNKTGRKLFRAGHGRLNASAAVVRAVPAPTLARTASVRLSIKKKPTAKTVVK